MINSSWKKVAGWTSRWVRVESGTNQEVYIHLWLGSLSSVLGHRLVRFQDFKWFQVLTFGDFRIIGYEPNVRANPK